MIDPNDLAKEVIILQKDVSQMAAITNRLDNAIEKIAELSTNISKLLAVQGNRLEVQEKVSERLEGILEKRNKEIEKELRALNHKIDTVENELNEEIESSFDKISNKLDSQQQAVEKRITKLEKWIWVVMGGATVAFWGLQKILPLMIAVL